MSELHLSESAKLIYPALQSLSPEAIAAFTTSAVEWIKLTYGRGIQPGVRCQTFTSTGEPILFLTDTPVCRVHSISINGHEWDDFDMLVDIGRDGKMTLGGSHFGVAWNQLAGWGRGVNNIRVSYTSEGVSQSMFDLYIGEILNWWIDANSRGVVVSSESIGDYSYVLNSAFAKGVPTRVATILRSLVPIRAC